MPIDALPKLVRERYEVHEWRHASAILERDFPREWQEVCDVLKRFRLCKTFITTPGGRAFRLARINPSFHTDRGKAAQAIIGFPIMEVEQL
jgi:hypothetical protein